MNEESKNHPKLGRAFAILAEKKIPWLQRAPWGFELLWSLGIAVRPPQFNSFGVNFILHAMTYSILSWGVFMLILVALFLHLAFVAGEGMQPFYALMPILVWKGVKIASLFGIAMGLFWAIVFTIQKRKLRIPDWKEI